MSNTGMRFIQIEIVGKNAKVNIEYDVPKTMEKKDLANEVKMIIKEFKEDKVNG